MPPKEESRTKDEAYLKQLEELREDLGLGKDGDTIARIAESVEKRLASTRSFTTAAGATNEDGSRATKGMTLGEFAQAVAVIEHPTRWNKQVSPDVRKALGEATGSTGGFLLYEQFVPELQKLVIEDQVVRPHAKVVPMTTDTI
jgi:HK97 family phage major capsid protein